MHGAWNMMDVDGPLDFESEDAAFLTPPRARKRKVIGLDDLLTDHYEGKGRSNGSTVTTKAENSYSSEEDDSTQENLFSHFVDECQGKMEELCGEEESCTWGLRAFTNQVEPVPAVSFNEFGSSVLRSFMNSAHNSMVEVDGDTAEEEFLSGLLVNGWLKRWVLLCGRMEASVSAWTFHLLLYSPTRELVAGADDLLRAALSDPKVVVEWVPTVGDLRVALRVYGFRSVAAAGAEEAAGFGDAFPPTNIAGWIRSVSLLSGKRDKYVMMRSASEAEELVVVVAILLLDRQLECFLVLLNECLASLVGYFGDHEWTASCTHISSVLAACVPDDLNRVKLIERVVAFHADSRRCVHLRSEIAHQSLLSSLGYQVDDEGILNWLMGINMKQRKCDLQKVYTYLVLTEYWLLPNNNHTLSKSWESFLHNCSLHVTTTDLRPFAPKIRTKATYLLQTVDSE